jgi:hypothetical protein
MPQNAHSGAEDPAREMQQLSIRTETASTTISSGRLTDSTTEYNMISDVSWKILSQAISSSFLL